MILIFGSTSWAHQKAWVLCSFLLTCVKKHRRNVSVCEVASVWLALQISIHRYWPSLVASMLVGVPAVKASDVQPQFYSCSTPLSIYGLPSLKSGATRMATTGVRIWSANLLFRKLLGGVTEGLSTIFTVFGICTLLDWVLSTSSQFRVPLGIYLLRSAMWTI